MRALFAQRSLALAIALVGLLSMAHGSDFWHAEYFDPCACEFDWQWFAPPHDFCCELNPPAKEGFFGEVERAHFWLLRPDRQPIGNNAPSPNSDEAIGVWLPNSVTLVWGSNPAPESTPFVIPIPGSAVSSLIYPVVGGGAQGFQFNAIDDGISETTEGWEERYTFGKICNDAGWMVSVIPEAKIHGTDFYGFDDKRRDQLGAAQGLDGIDGIPDEDGAAGTGIPVPPVAPVPSAQGILPIDGLLTVPVLFNDPFRLLLGAIDEDGNGIGDDGTMFPIIQGDLSRIAVVFDDLRATTEMRITSVELMLVRRKARLHSGFDLEGYFGARYFEMDDFFGVFARGGVLTDSEWNNNAENRIVGPQIGCRASRQKGPWVTTLQSRFMAGANFLSIRQDGVLGSHLPIGFAGVPYRVGGNSFFHRLNDETFSPLGELRFDLALQVTRAINVKAGWTGIAAGGISRAANTIRYDFPQMGILKNQEHVFTHAVSFGVELNR